MNKTILKLINLLDSDKDEFLIMMLNDKITPIIKEPIDVLNSDYSSIKHQLKKFLIEDDHYLNRLKEVAKNIDCNGCSYSISIYNESINKNIVGGDIKESVCNSCMLRCEQLENKIESIELEEIPKRLDALLNENKELIELKAQTMLTRRKLNKLLTKN